jgi:hypothetical protein
MKVYCLMRMLPLRTLYGSGNLSENCIYVSRVLLTRFAYVTWTSRLWLLLKGKLLIYLRRKVTHVLYNRPNTVKSDSEFGSLDFSRGVKIDVISSGIDAVQSDKGHSIFRRNVLPPFSWSKNKPSKRPAQSRLCLLRCLQSSCSFRYNRHEASLLSPYGF